MRSSNRYLWLALGLALMLVLSLTAIVLLDVSDRRTEAAIGLALKAVVAVSSVGTAVFGVMARRKGRESAPPQPTFRPPGMPYFTRTASATVADESSSLSDYIAQLRAQVAALAGERTGFVALTTTKEEIGRVIAPELLPNAEWMSRRYGQEYVRAVPEEIDLVDISERFRLAVLLGEPGSGKSTCLQHLALTATGRVERDPTAPLPLLASLSDWEDPSVKAVDFLRSRLEALLGPSSYFVHHFEALLVSGRFVLLLDGLNEMPHRKVSDREGQHEQPSSGSMQGLARSALPRVDPRERSLHELAESTALQSRFVVTCRSHEYADSLAWQVIRLLPMTGEQIDRFLDVYLDPPRLDELQLAIDRSPALAAMATNPFFLRSIIEVYTPGVQLESRGQVLAYLHWTLLEREARLRPGEATADREVIEHIGPVAFRMIERGEIGGQAALRVGDSSRRIVDRLLGTGLIIERNGSLFFLHQIVQEFFAAAALRDRVVRKRPLTLLRDKRWSEVVALWHDLDPDRVYKRVVGALRARNFPWRRPRSLPSPALSVYMLLMFCLIVAVLAIVFYELVFGSLGTLSVLFGAVALPPLVVLLTVIAIRLAWGFLILHRGIVVNAAYVLALTRRPAAIPKLIPVFRRMLQKQRGEVAHSLAMFGDAALPHVLQGLESPHWRVRLGCVQTLGEFLRVDPTHPEVTEIVLALAHAEDPQLGRVLGEALSRCRDERAPDAIAHLVEHVVRGNAMAVAFRLQPLADLRSTRATTKAPVDVLTRLENFAAADQPPAVRAFGFQLLGGLRATGCEQMLANVAIDPREVAMVRKGAIAGLGLAETPEAVDWLVQFAGSYGDLAEDASAALARLRDQAVLPTLAAAASSDDWRSRQAVAAPLGGVGGPGALPVLAQLAEDPDEDVREATARGLAAIGRADAVPLLERLSRDPYPAVRHIALQAIDQRYPDLAAPALLRLALDPGCPDRVRAIRLLDHHFSADVERALIQLAGSPDKEVRDAGEETLRRLHALAHERFTTVRPRWWRHPIKTVRARAHEKLGIKGLKEMWAEEQLVGAHVNDRAQRFNRMWFRLVSDTELSAEYRVAVELLTFMILGAAGFVCLILVLLVLLTLPATRLMLEVWPFTAGFLAFAALIGILSWRGREVPFGGIVVGLAIATVVVGILGALVYTWWLWVAVLALVAFGWAAILAGSRRRSRAAISAVLRQRPTALALA